jgi:hypothetical protein
VNKSSAYFITMMHGPWAAAQLRTAMVMEGGGGSRTLDLKMAVFWVVVPCSLVEVYQRLRGPCCLHHQGDGSG